MHAAYESRRYDGVLSTRMIDIPKGGDIITTRYYVRRRSFSCFVVLVPLTPCGTWHRETQI